LLARLTAIAVLGISDGGEGAASAILPLWAIVVSACLAYVDLRRRQELALLHNLGVTTVGAIGIGVIPAVLLEAALTLFPR
jgi:hypothetical protein